jgi:4-alpha-glucanotransferase
LPFINDSVLNDVFGHLSDVVKSEFLQPLGNGNYGLKTQFNTQMKIEAYFIEKEQIAYNHRLKQGLFDILSNVILFEEESDQTRFHFRISIENTLSFKGLDADTQHKLKDLYIHYFFRRQDKFWYERR